jgi:hypothetical protein
MLELVTRSKEGRPSALTVRVLAPRKECNKLKEALKKQGNCPHCGKEGHLKDECFKQYPDKKPKWMKGKFGTRRTETSTSNLEVQLASLEQDF